MVEKSMKCNIGLLGCGTVGGGIVEIVEKNSSLAANAQIKRILVRNKSKYSSYDQNKITTNADEILNDDSINVVIEVMGGIHPAYEYINRALKAHKHVITANKELLSLHLRELLALAKENNVRLLFEASVCGGVPIIRNVISNSQVNPISHIEGILNGSTNFLLSLVQKEKVSIDDGLERAKELGFLEADPTDDICGYDAKRKLAILSMLAYKKIIDPNDIYTYPLKNLNDEFIKNVKKLGYVMRYIASSTDNGSIIEADVVPTLVTMDDIYSLIGRELNIVMINGSNTGKLEFIGKGAGRFPTANAVVSDLWEIILDAINANIEIVSIKAAITNNTKYRYLVQSHKELNEDKFKRIDECLYISNPISLYELREVEDLIEFMARIKN